MGECYVDGLMEGESFLQAKRIADLTYDLQDTAWLEVLHEEDVPFPMEDVVLI